MELVSKNIFHLSSGFGFEMKLLFQIVIIAVTFNIYSEGSYLKFNKVLCSSSGKTIKNLICYVKAYNRTVNMVGGSGTLIKTVNKAYVS